jgi:pimeloyl-ACP methyl ester carboxylesterase
MPIPDHLSHYETINGLRLHYLADGDPDAPPALLLHGGGIDSAWISWRHLIPALAETHRVLALDFPGYGRSQPPDTAYTTDLLVQTVLAFLDRFNLDQVDLVGLSMGGATALGVALAAPHRIRRLVLVDGYGLQDRAPVQPLSFMALQTPAPVQRLAWATLRGNPLVMRLGLTAIFRNPFRLTSEVLTDAAESVRLELFYEWLQSEINLLGTATNYSRRLGQVRLPVRLIHGEHDPSIPLRWARRAAKRLPQGELVIIPNCGHWPNRERPNLFNKAVLAFVSAE